MKKTFKGTLALAFCIVTVFATMLIASALSAPKAKVKTVTYNTVTISWSKISGADAYQVQRSTDGKKWTTLTSSTKSTSYKDSKLTAGKTYRYRVRSVDKGLLRSTYSSWSSVVKGKPVPAKVTGLKASSKTKNSVKLTWTKVSGASGYVVQKYTNGAWKTYKTTTKTGMTISKLTLGKTYSFRVRAYRTVSKKKVYGPFTSTYKAGPELKAPSSFVLKGVTTSTLKLAWSAVDGAKGYEVYNKSTKKWTNTKTKRTLTVKNLKAGTSYGFIVRAYSGSYDGVKTSTRTYTTTPAAPKSVKSSSSTTTSVKFSWGKVTGATRYQPAIYDYSTKKWTNLSTTTATSATAKSLTSGTKYKVRVRAYVKNSNVKDISANSYGSWSSEVTVYTATTAPKSVYLTDVTTTTLTVGWSASTGATSYEIYNPVKKAWVSTGSSRSSKISGLAAGTKYSFKVRAVASGVKSADSSSYSFITTPAAPTQLKNTATLTTVNGVTFSDATKDSITVTWKAVTGASKYQVQYSADGKTWTSLSETTATTATAKNLKAGTEYQIRVRAYVKNSNVSGISSTAYGAYATAKFKTLNADTSITATSYDSRNIQLNWQQSDKATGYVVEKFDSSNGWKYLVAKQLTNGSKQYSWVTFDGLSNLSEEHTFIITDLSYLDPVSSARSEIYRVRIVGADGLAGAPSNIAMGTTADIAVTSDAYSTTIEWPAIASSTNSTTAFSIYNMYPYVKQLGEIPVSKLQYNSTKNTYKATLYLAPESIHSLLIIPNGTGTYQAQATLVTGALPTDSSDSAKNSQLIYLARAINNTKEYQNTIAVKNNAQVSYEINELHFRLGLIVRDYNSPKEIKEFFSSLGDSEDMVVTSNEKFSSDLTFTKGKATNSAGRTENLKYSIEPSAVGMHYANLYNGLTSATAWKSGFDKVSTTKNSDGSYTITATIKKEKGKANYHDGFVSSFSEAAALGSTDGFEMSNVTVGPTTLKATISPDGILKNYDIVSPYSTTVSASLTGDEGGDAGLLDDLLEISMTMNGSTDYSLTFTR